MDSGRWFKKLMAGLREAGDKNLEQLKEAQGTFLELFRRFYGQEEYRKLVEKLTDAAFLFMKIRESAVRQPEPFTDRNFREVLPG